MLKIDLLKQNRDKVEENIIYDIEENQRIRCNNEFPPLKRGNTYSLVGEGSDYYAVKSKGTPIQIPKWVFDYIPKKKWIENE